MLKNFILLPVFISCVSAQVGPRVTTKYGEVVGVSVNLNSGKVINSFYAIPFAKAPTGSLRFKPPEEPDPWSGPRQCQQIGPVCPQSRGLSLLWLTHAFYAERGGEFSEDCLHLNIHAPATGGPYPVMFWIHGGAYTGSANIQYPGHFLAGHDVVVVVINYRLGHLGFMSTDDEASPGNYGLMDQVQALRFVRDNIRAFNGDPNRVTIFGQSAGASSSGLLNLIPSAQGLFHQMILESGSDISVWSVNGREQKPETYTRRVAEQLNCARSTNQEMMDCLRRIDDFDLIRETNFDCTPGHFCQGFAPVVDGDFIPDHPAYLREEGKFNPITTMHGLTSEDGSLYTIAFVPEAADGNITRTAFHRYLRRLIDYFAVRFPDRNEDMYRALDFKYSPWPHVDDMEDNRQAFNTIITDVAFGTPGDAAMKLMADKGANVYSYVLAFRSSNASELFPEWMGVPHNGELPYVWGFPLLQLNEEVREQQDIFFLDIIDWNQDDIEFTHFIQTLWTNFAKYGNPTPEPVPIPFSNQTLTWPMFDAKNNDLKYTWLDRKTEVKQNYRQKNHAFWNKYVSRIVPEMWTPERPPRRPTTEAPPRCTCPTVGSGTRTFTSFSLPLICIFISKLL